MSCLRNYSNTTNKQFQLFIQPINDFNCLLIRVKSGKKEIKSVPHHEYEFTFCRAHSYSSQEHWLGHAAQLLHWSCLVTAFGLSAPTGCHASILQHCTAWPENEYHSTNCILRTCTWMRADISTSTVSKTGSASCRAGLLLLLTKGLQSHPGLPVPVCRACDAQTAPVSKEHTADFLRGVAFQIVRRGRLTSL